MAHDYSEGFSDKKDNEANFANKYSVGDAGPFVGVVKDTEDPMRMGRLGVVIPALAHVDGRDPPAGNIIWCQYLSPFYGAKPIKAVSSAYPYSFEQGQTAYGMWAIPPDIDTNVLVIFARGRKSQSNAFWLGCIQEPLANQMVPGLASSTNSKMDLRGTGTAGTIQEAHDRRDLNYGTTLLPVIEKNRKDRDMEDINSLQQWRYPVNEDLAYQLMYQGLIHDPIRGTTTSSARREAPSAVFGMSTPGRIKPDSRTPPIGLEGRPVSVDRSPGHSFVMDDGDEFGDNQLIRLRTASGHQFLMHDRDGIVYIANASGNAWIEMNSEGRIDVYSGIGGINLRTEGDFNLHSDSNVTISAGNEIRMGATGKDKVLYTENDTAVQKGHKTAGEVKRPAYPGTIIHSADYVFNVGEKGIFNSSMKGAVQTYGAAGITSYTSGQQLHGAAGGTHLAGGQIHFNSVGYSTDWGPQWNKEKLYIAPTYEGDVELVKKFSTEPLEAFSRKQKTKTIVHRLVTHEPMLRFKSFSTEGKIPPIAEAGAIAEAELVADKNGYVAPLGPRGDPMKKAEVSAIQKTTEWISKKTSDAKKLVDETDRKVWAQRASIPGTVENMEWINRNSKIQSIKLAQFQSDAQKYLKDKLGITTNKAKANELLQNFGVHYDETFGIEGGADSISSIMTDNLLNEIGVGSTIDKDFTSMISNQILDSVSGDVKDIFKDNLYFDQAGRVLNIGQDLHGQLKKFTDVKYLKANAKAIALNEANKLVTGTISKELGSILKSSNFGNKILENSTIVKNIGKNIVQGKITNVSQISSFWKGSQANLIKKAGPMKYLQKSFTGSKFLKSGAAGGAGLSWTQKLATTSVGKAVGQIFKGNFKIGGISLSDIRLKENIQLVGKSPSGINIYRFKYKHINGIYEGVMAQEVLWASKMTDVGYYVVDYSKVDVDFRRLN